MKSLLLPEANLGKLRLSVSSRELSRDGETRTRKYLNYFANRLYRNQNEEDIEEDENEDKDENKKEKKDNFEDEDDDEDQDEDQELK